MSVFAADEQRRPVDLDRLRRLAAFAARSERVPDGMELSLLCVDVDAMTALNREHMDSHGPTDVLAFPLDRPGETLAGQPAILGDVVLCPEVAAAQAAQHEHSEQEELDLLCVHGVLHLLGYDHADERDRAVMFGRTDELLTAFSEEHGT